MADHMPEIPGQTIENWQRIVNLIAKLAEVPASLVMRTQAPHHSVLYPTTKMAHLMSPAYVLRCTRSSIVTLFSRTAS